MHRCLHSWFQQILHAHIFGTSFENSQVRHKVLKLMSHEAFEVNPEPMRSFVHGKHRNLIMNF